MKPKVLITGNVPKEWLGELNDIANVTIWNGNSSFFIPREKLLYDISRYSALLNFTDVKTDEELLKKAVNLKIVANCSIGFDNLNIPLMTTYGVWASNAPGFFNYPVAEYVLAGILLVSRRLLEANEFVKNGEWKSFEPGRWDGTSIKDKTVGIVGLGTIGKELRRIVKPLGAKVIYHTSSPKRELGWVSFDRLLEMSDIISINVPLSRETYGLFSRKVIAKMKPGVILVNTSRGAIVDEEALTEGLKSGRIGAAVLDVFRNEPSVPSTLLRMKNVLLTPHVAGGTHWSREASFRTAAKNVVEVLKGNKPVNHLNNLPQ